ncbi:hypothetical protein DHEL01_v212309 [Diaporthe helianthi]|uniref:DUF3533 domain-containing protein n=1 Tax=Diaporthe helianthi TaxID=158607 RepID=A0A2P5HGC4_DIAHE|nr:hypothetical protein DHEL01_v212309 [Diaporthe helianthi]
MDSEADTSRDGLPSPQKYFAMTRKPFLKAIIISGLILNILFLANMSYIFGSIFQNTGRTHALRVLLVDYDGGVVSQSIRAAYSDLKADSFITVSEQLASDFGDTEAIQDAVCSGDYWAALYVTPDASANLARALEGGPAAENFNASSAVGVVWNEIHYPVISQGYVYSALQTLLGATSSVYHSIHGTQALSTMNQSDPAARAALFRPISFTTKNLTPVPTGAKVLWNTATIPFLIIMQFFFVLALNSTTLGFAYYSKIPSKNLILLRLGISIVYTFIASLTSTGYIWAFRQGFHLTGSQFVGTWMAIWLTNHANFLFLDTATAIVPMAYMSHVVLTWIILNVTSTINPLELSAGFYRLGYAWPYHNLYEILVTIWSNGCVNRVYRNLPIIFAWWIVLFGLSLWAQLRKCRNSQKQAELEGPTPPQRGASEQAEKPGSADSSD